MSLLTRGIGFTKKIKHAYADRRKATAPVFLSPVRRIERVKTDERIVAMTFDDGPCRLSAVPGGTESLTEHLAATLERHGAHGTFDIVGDTGANYPDKPGKTGSAAWGGIRYDHYPQFGADNDGGAKNCPELIRRLLDGGHEITNHTYSHILFGKKAAVYGRRKTLSDFGAVLDDLQRLHDLMREQYGYTMRLSRPPHYVDRISPGISSYDAYALMGYQYMAASFDGAGWLPLATYQAEVEATVRPLATALEHDPNALCGQIIFQKDGCNMAKRTPIADGLEQQLELLDRYGYKVVSVSELLTHSPFADVGQSDPLFPTARKLLDAGLCVAYRDNSVRPDKPITVAELAMLLYGTQSVQRRLDLIRGQERIALPCKTTHPYSGAIATAMERAELRPDAYASDAPITAAEFTALCTARFGHAPDLSRDVALDRAKCFQLIADMI